MQPRPPVSLDSWSGGDRVPDVLVSGTEREPRLTPAARRRLRLGSAVVVVVVAAVAGGLEAQDRRVAAAEERRLAGLLQLSADMPSSVTLKADPPSDSAVVEMTVTVYNGGPRAVTVTQASAGSFVLLAPVPLPAQAGADLVMRQALRCLPDGPPRDRETRNPLRITARTSRGTQTIDLAWPLYFTEHAAHACTMLAGRGPAPRGLSPTPARPPR